MPGYEQHDKYLQRIGPDAGGVDERLVDEVVHKLRSLHDGEYDEDEYPHVDVQTYSSAVFEYQAETDADDIPDERSHIWNDVQDAGYEGDTDSIVHPDPRDQPQPQEIQQHHSHHFDRQPHEIAREQHLDVEYGLPDGLFNAVGNQCSDYLSEEGFVLDEGGAVVTSPALGVKGDYAMVGVSEKGVCDTIVTMHGLPGHSSTPKDTDAPMRLVRAIERIEQKPDPAVLSETTKYMLTEIARDASFALRIVFGNLWLFAPLVRKIMASNPETNAMVRSTVALTKLQGSHTVNVIPNEAVAAFSVRVAPWNTTQEMMDKIAAQAGEHADVTSEYRVEPSPVSPVKSDAFSLLQNVVDAVYPGVPAVPYVMNGGTDSKHFTRICDKVYRFAGFRFTNEERAAMHGNDETLRTESYLDGVQFYIQLLKSI